MDSEEDIKDCDGVQAAVQKEQSEPIGPGRERYIIKRAVELGCTEHIPDDWGIA